jgi:hypothetical protein
MAAEVAEAAARAETLIEALLLLARSDRSIVNNGTLTLNGSTRKQVLPKWGRSLAAERR